jgi:plasmid stabilization system protein ParE
MECKVIWTEPAIGDLREIVLYISKDDPEAAGRIGQDIIDTVEVLATFPLIGQRYGDTRWGEVREVLCWNYRIFYRVLQKKRLVEVLHVRHGARREW